MSQSRPETILVVDDEEAVLNSVRRTLRSAGLGEVVTSSDPREVLDLLDANDVAVMLLDLVMPHIGGRDVLARVAELYPEIPVIVVTAEQDARTAVECMKLGAWDYLLKPASAEELVATVERAMQHREVVDENRGLRSKLLNETLERPEAFNQIVTDDQAMERVFAYLEVVARGSHPILITGETGTGKELIAKAIHRVSGSRGPFVAVNVAGLDDTMFSDTLFGHRPGAFTGASGVRKGMVENAAGGTLFLDEIGDLAEASQVKLLRLLQEREYQPLGADSSKRLEARVVAATHQDASKLRTDLYFRLRSYHVRIPPLRERMGDLPLLIGRFVREAAQDLKKEPPKVPQELYRALGRYQFPGNIRELRAMAFDAVARHAEGTLPIEPFVESMSYRVDGDLDGAGTALQLSSGMIITDSEWKELERTNIVNALERSNWKISGRGGAADLLGLRPSTLESRIKSFSIQRP